MNKQNEITDEDFVPFLHSLGVETYKKSFEWMFSDPAFSGVFTWLYNNLDHNNALTTREEYRYAELEKTGQLLSPEDLETCIAAIQQEYPGICIPGDNESLEDVKLNIQMQKEKLHFLEKQERIIKDLIKENELVKEQVAIEITKLNSAQHQYAEDEAAAAEECLTLAEEVETLTEGVVDVIAQALDLYGNCHVDKETARKFLTFSPLDSYRQSQALFRSHFDLYTARKFGKKQADMFTDEDLRSAIVDAKNLEDRLSDAAYAYIESKAELCGEQAKLALVANYNNVHPSQITTVSLEAQTALELLAQEEGIVDQQIQSAVKELVNSRTRLAVDTATKAALAVREQIDSDLSHLLELSQQALALDRLLYCALRHELRTVEECVQFAAQLQQHVAGEAVATRSRIESMNEITAEQNNCLENIHSKDLLIHFLSSIFGAQTDDVAFVKMFGDLLNKIKELKDDVRQGYRSKEESIVDFKKSYQPLKRFIFDGCTKQPNCYDRVVSSLTHSLTSQLESVEKTVVELGGQFTQAKNGDKQNLRKLWQWFLTDPPRLHAACKGIQTANYS